MTYHTRADWGARPSNGGGNTIGSHPLGVAVHYEGPKMGSRDHSKCAALVRSIQDFHMDSRGWADVAYNFLVCEHGDVYEGRGIGRGSAANGTTQGNKDFYAVCALVGEGDNIPTALTDGVRDAIDLCRRNGAGDKLVGHRDLFATLCPGDRLYAWMRAGAPRSTTVGGGGAAAPVHIPAKVDPTPTPTPMPKPPAASSSLRNAQASLKRVGFNPGAIDGVNGPNTKAAVKGFQTAAGLVVDGIVGPHTLSALAKVPAYPGLTRQGQEGAATLAYQKRLKARGWSIATDSDHGPATTAALKAFQKEKGLRPVDGVGGPATWTALYTRGL